MDTAEIILKAYNGTPPNNLPTLVKVYETIQKHPNLASNLYHTMLQLDRVTVWRAIDSLSKVGLMDKGPVVNKPQPSIPTVLREGYVPVDHPFTHLAYILAKFKPEDTPPGFPMSVAQIQETFTKYFQEHKAAQNMIETLQEILAVFAVCSGNYGLFKNPASPVTLPDLASNEIMEIFDKFTPEEIEK